MIGIYFSFDEIHLIKALFCKFRLNKEVHLRKLGLKQEDIVLLNDIFEKIDEAYKFYNL